MPIYEFRCNACQCSFETLVLSTDGIDKVVCSKCGSRDIKKTISATSFRLAGGGSNVPLGSGNGGCSSRSGFS
ncbi:MAG: hypothetical protein A2521_12975 [Deltaproteobacteria bacterium RIFOXYD12_FULL_57_12]|nr:MAG: hypothetical protein A2521_12975 [Deltaproteobacteria bacterium RIFOXYD12_FULL_57_12]